MDDDPGREGREVPVGTAEWICRQNISRWTAQLAVGDQAADRAQIGRLIAEEQARLRDILRS